MAACFTHQTACAYDYTQNFTAGWHLISLPCYPSNTLPSVVFASPFDDVIALQSTGYQPKSAMISVVYGAGYWAWFASDTTVSVSGTAVNIIEITIPLYAGWNLIGSPFTTSLWASATINTGGGDIPVNTSTNFLWDYDSASSRYATSSVFLEQWKGYFIRTSAAGTLILKNNGYVPPDPDSPTNVQANPCVYGTKTLLCLSWTPPTNPDMGKYKVYVYHTTEQFDDPYSGNVLIPKAMYTVGGLTPGQNYGIEVTAVKDVNGQVLKESEHSMRAARSTVANAGNQAVVSFRAVAATGGQGAGRVAYKTGGGVPAGLEVVPDAQVELRNSSGALMGNGTSDAFGWAEFSGGFASDSYSVDAVKDLGAPGYSTEDIKVHTTVSLNSGMVKHLGDLELKETGYIYGTVVLADVAPPSDQYLFAHVVIPGTMYDAWCDRSGNYMLHWVPPTSATDTYSIVALRDDYGPVEQTGLTVNPKEYTHAATMTLYSDKGTISGAVRDEDGLPLADVAVSPQYSGLYGQTGATGSFMITLVPAATYTVIFSKTGYESRSAAGVVVTAPNETVIPPITLPFAYSQLEIAPLSTTIAVGATHTQQFTATGTLKNINPPYRNLTNLVTWSSANSSVGAISSTGLFTASATNTGSTTITAGYATSGISVSTTLAVHVPPSIATITPVKGNNDVFTSVTVTGNNFVSGASLYIGDYPAANVSVFLPTQLVAQVPYSMPTGTYPVKVTNPDGLYSASCPSCTFTVELPPPTIESVSPLTGDNTETTQITITGAPFIAGPALAVKIGTTSCLNVHISANGEDIEADVPPGIQYGKQDITVINGDGKPGTKTGAFTVTIPGNIDITGIDPDEGVNNAETEDVAITGNNFASGAVVYIQKGFNSLALDDVVVETTTKITATVPSGLPWGTYDIKVVNVDYNSKTAYNWFKVTLPAPEITTVTPTSMFNSEQQFITLAGTNFAPGSTVTIGTTDAVNVTVATSTQLTAVVPAGIVADKYDIKVKNPDSDGLSYTKSGAFTVYSYFLITISPQTLPIAQGASAQFSAACRYTDGQNSFDNNCTNIVVWSSSNPSLGVISATGTFTASASNAGDLNVFAQKGTLYSSDIPVNVFNPNSLFTDSMQRLGGGVTLSSVFAEDVNNDGYPDIIEGTDSGVKIWKNNGSGVFTTSTTIGSGGSVFAADANNDGYPDIVEGANGVTIWGNNGSGGFFASTTVGSGDWVRTVFAADVNKDGYIDIVEGVYNGVVGVKIWWNNKLGGFASPPTTIGGNDKVMSVFATDVNNDGYPDILEGIFGGGVKIWKNNGSAGGFTLLTTIGNGDNLYAVFAADLNNDGYTDILEGIEWSSGGGVNIWYNGPGGFPGSPSTNIGSGPTAVSVFAADVNNDGYTDIIEGTDNDGVKIWLNDKSGGFPSLLSTTIGSGDIVLPIFAADVNNDRNLDIIEGVWGWGSSIIKIWNGGNGILPNSKPSLPSLFGSYLTPFDTDGMYNDATISWSDGSDTETPLNSLTYNIRMGPSPANFGLNSGVTTIGYGNVGATKSMTIKNLPFGQYYYSGQTIDTGFQKSDWYYIKSFVSGPDYVDSVQNLPGSDQTYSVFAADVNNDGYPDILEGGDYGVGFMLWLNDKSGGFPSYTTIESGETIASVFAADVNNDGYMDIIKGPPCCLTSGVKIWLNDKFGGFTTPPITLGNGDYASPVFAADMNNDGYMDIIASTGGGVKIWRNNKLGGFALPPTTIGSGGYVFAVDVNDDGYPDIIEGTNSGVKIWKNNGSGGFSQLGPTIGIGDQVNSIFAADVDNDGYPDIIEGIWGGGVKIWKNNGSGSFSQLGFTIGSGDSVYSVFAADANNDGYPDILEGILGGGIKIWLNDKSGGFPGSLSTIAGSGDTVRSVFMAYLNNDGYPDIIEGIYNGVVKVRYGSQVAPNIAPSAPTGVTSSVAGATATLKWSPATDDRTPAIAMTYNLVISTNPAFIGGNAVSPPFVGNVGHPPVNGGTGKHEWKLTPGGGTYYWAVQSVDAGYKHSTWTIPTPSSFTIP